MTWKYKARYRILCIQCGSTHERETHREYCQLNVCVPENAQKCSARIHSKQMTAGIHGRGRLGTLAKKHYSLLPALISHKENVLICCLLGMDAVDKAAELLLFYSGVVL